MNKTKKSTISGAFFMSLTLGLGAAAASADELAQAPPAPPPPAAAPAPAGAPPAAGAAPGAPAPPAPAAPTSPLIGPALAGSLTIQLPPPKYTIPYLGDIYVDGIGSGLYQWQSNPVPNVLPGNNTSVGGLNNGQVFVQKTDGIFQFYAQAGAYSISALGSPYISTQLATWGANSPAGDLWGWFPQGFVKIVPNDSFSLQAGKLPSLLGAEDTFSFQNINIERGLLWGQEPSISKGGQANYTIGPVALSLSFTDGFDSGVWNWVTGSATYTLNPSNTFVFSAGGNAGSTRVNTLRTPILQSNSQIYDLIYTYNSDPWIIQPYFQATHVPTNTGLYGPSASSFGGALLINYDVGAGVNLGGRVEYMGTTGNNNLLLGPGSGAFSLTFTPTYQYRYFFLRGEVSFVKANSITDGLAFGSNGTADTQTRLLVETGILF
jgi:Putative beta-barrel porin-2, OmpL-like. bbp2